MAEQGSTIVGAVKEAAGHVKDRWQNSRAKAKAEREAAIARYVANPNADEWTKGRYEPTDEMLNALADKEDQAKAGALADSVLAAATSGELSRHRIKELLTSTDPKAREAALKRGVRGK